MQNSLIITVVFTTDPHRKRCKAIQLIKTNKYHVDVVEAASKKLLI